MVENVAERLLWRGSAEEAEVQKINVRGGLRGEVQEGDLQEKGKRYDIKYKDEGLRGGFWNGAEEGAREIGRVGKAE